MTKRQKSKLMKMVAIVIIIAVVLATVLRDTMIIAAILVPVLVLGGVVLVLNKTGEIGGDDWNDDDMAM